MHSVRNTLIADGKALTDSGLRVDAADAPLSPSPLILLSYVFVARIKPGAYGGEQARIGLLPYPRLRNYLRLSKFLKG